MTPHNKIVLATYGTHGDLHPFMAIALGLRQRGFDPVIASSRHFRGDVEAAGLRFYPLRPSQQQIEADLGMSRAEMLRAAKSRPQIILTKFFLPYLQQSYEDSLAALSGAQLAITSSVAFGPKLAVEKLGIPHLGILLQPYTLLSAYDPPLLSNALLLSRLANRSGVHTARALLQLGRFLSKTWAKPVHDFRRRIGLPRSSLHPFFEGQFIGAQPIGLYSHLLGDIQPDFPRQFVIAGFAFYDRVEGAIGLEPELQKFLEVGPPPLVFTQGTSAVHDSTRFVEVALEAVRRLGERAVLVLDEEQRHALRGRTQAGVLVCSYVPYSQLFHRARVIVHHGGIGTTAQALRAGRPQLIAPYFVDQPDNAARVERLGVARLIPLDRWTPVRVIRELRALLTDAQLSARAEAVAREIVQEDGVATVVRIASELLAGAGSAVSSVQ